MQDQTPRASSPTKREVPPAAKGRPSCGNGTRATILGATGGVGDRTWIKGFQAAGRNASGRTIERFGGYIESEITGERHPLMINLGGTLKPITETTRIPNVAEFDKRCDFPISTLRSRSHRIRPASLPTSSASQWRSFKFVFTFDGGKYVRELTSDDIEKLLRRFHEETHRDVKPRVSQWAAIWNREATDDALRM
jgi:hypothetical protein